MLLPLQWREYPNAVHLAQDKMMFNQPSQVVVAIPAMNEAERIGGCLASLAEQIYAPSFLTVVLANNCTDQTAAIAQAWSKNLPGLHVVQQTFPSDQSHAGAARRCVMEYAARLCTDDGFLLTTDADTQVPPNWIAANLKALAAGADAVAGRAIIDPIEARLIPRHLHELDAIECAYAALLDEIHSFINPDPCDPWPRHDEHSGASIAVRRAAWEAVGGIPLQPTGEDRAFFASLRRMGARIRHAPDIAVIVSGRLEGRAAGGMAETIRSRIAAAPEWLDDRLIPLAELLQRLRGVPLKSPPSRVAFCDVASQTALAKAFLAEAQSTSAGSIKAATGS
jgi:glycosyltransferase involved in cell wall biosynthesis